MHRQHGLISNWKSITQTIDQQTQISSSNIAIEFHHTLHDIEKISYYELCIKSNNIALFLLQQGIKKGDLIGICHHKDPLLYITILALWRLGAVYVPLSENLSIEDLQFRFKNSGVSHLIAEPQKKQQIDPEKTCHVIDYANLKQASLANSVEKFASVTLHADDAAYLIYTSGTTGTPKGILLPHAGIVSCYESHAKVMNLTSHEKILQMADIRVDVSIMEILLAFCSGSTLCASPLPPDELAIRLPQILANDGITTAIIPPTLLKSLIQNKTDTDLQYFLESDLEKFTHLISATEAVTPETLTAWQYRGQNKKRRIYNGYGSTEETIGATICEYHQGRVSLGTQQDVMQNKQLYILQEGLLLRSGKGELCVAGEGLAIGYWKDGHLDKEKTNEYFITATTPHHNEIIRIYKTGDLVEFENGLWFFISRIANDQQVEIAGNRIEMSGVAKKLEKHPHIQKAIIKKKDARLSAYLVLDPFIHITLKDIRACLHSTKNFNSAEIPANYYQITLDQVNLVINDKIKDDELINLLNDIPYVAPNHIEETKIQAIWENLFGIQKISVTVDFYDIGGYSLLLTKILHAIEETFDITLDFNELPNPLTIQSLAKHILALKVYSKSIYQIAGIGNDVNQPILLFTPPLIGGHSKKYKALTDSLPTNLRCCALSAPLLNKSAELGVKTSYQTMMHEDMLEIAKYYFREICRIISYKTPIALSGWSFGGLLAFELATQLKKAGYHVVYLGLIDAQPPGKLKTMSYQDHLERLRNILNVIGKKYGVESHFYFLKENSLPLENKETLALINYVFETAIKNILASSISTDKKNGVLFSLKTARANYLATFSYTTTSMIDTFYSFVANDSGETKNNTDMANTWNAHGNVTELVIPNTNHFNILGDHSFKKLFLESLEIVNRTHSIRKITGLLHNRFLMEQNSNHAYKEYMASKPNVYLSNKNTNDESAPLQFVLNSFLKKPTRNPLLILGESTAGKTSATIAIEQMIWESNNDSHSPLIPIRLALRGVRNSDITLYIKDILKDILDDEKMSTLKDHCQLVIILDGLEELPSNEEFYFEDDLLKGWKKKIILTSKSHHFRHVYSSALNDLDADNLPEVYYLSSLTPAMIDGYLSQMSANRSQPLSAYQYKFYLTHYSFLRELTTHPKSLRAYTEALPKLLTVTQTDDTPDLNFYSLYESIIDSFMMHEKNKPKRAHIPKREHLLHVLACIALELRLAGKKEFKLRPQTRESLLSFLTNNDSRQNTEKHVYLMQDFNNDVFKYIINNHFLLKLNTKGNFEFIHESFIDFFSATAIMAAILNDFSFHNYLTEENVAIHKNAFDGYPNTLLFIFHSLLLDEPLLKKLLSYKEHRSENTLTAKSLLAQMEFPFANLEQSTTESLETRVIHYPGRINALAFTPNSLLLALAIEKRIELRSLNTDLIKARLIGHKRPILSVAFSRDGSLLASSSSDQTIRLWSINDLSCVVSIDHMQNFVFSVCFDFNADIFFAGSTSGALIKWEKNTGQSTLLANLNNECLAVRFRPDGKFVSSATGDGRLLEWPIDPREEKITYTLFDSRITSFDYSFDSKMIAVGSQNNLKIITTDAKKVLRNILLGNGEVTQIHFHANQNYCLVGMTNGMIYEIDALAGQVVETFTHSHERITGLVYGTQQIPLISTSHDQNLIFWQRKPTKHASDHKTPIKKIIFDETKHCFILLEEKGVLWKKTVGNRYKAQPFLDKQEIRDISNHHAQAFFAVLFADNSVQIWQRGLLKHSLQIAYPEALLACAINHDGTKLALVSASGIAFEWHVENNQLAMSILNGPATISPQNVKIAYNHNGQLIGFLCSERMFNWCTQTNRLLYQCEMPFNCFAFSAKNNFILAGGKALYEWSYSTNTSTFLNTKCDNITCVAYSADESLIAAGSGEGLIYVWNKKSGHLLQTIHAHDLSVLNICFSGNEHLASSSQDGTLYFWQVGVDNNNNLNTFHLHSRMGSTFFSRRTVIDKPKIILDSNSPLDMLKIDEQPCFFLKTIGS